MAEPVGGVVPYLSIDGAAQAAEFYKRAFGAEELERVPAQDGKRLMHCHLMINGGSVMLSDFFPEHGYEKKVPQGFTLHLQVTDGQTAWDRAIEAGASQKLKYEKQFWGDTYGQLIDPFGVTWSIGCSQ